MESETIRYDAKESIVVITLNRPDTLNAMNVEMRDSLKGALSNAADDERVRVVILTGAGRAFCAGADLKRFAHDYEHYKETGESSRFYDLSLPRLMAFFPKPIIAAINGPAVGVGMTMALACDIRLASESASFGCPFTRIGLTPEFGSSYYLPRLVGYSKAAEWTLTSRMINAQEALSTGLISEVFGSGVDVVDEARKMAHTIADMPKAAILSAKKLLRQAMDLNFHETLEEEKRVFQNCQKEHEHFLAVTRVMEQIRRK
jgi:2-(1,2-epoxy-1,2-dihydrophenyl)acetyl-CoA isomerase